REAYPVDIPPPGWLVEGVASYQPWPGIRPLVAVAEAPYLRADGTIGETPGYDPQTGVLYVPAMEFPSVPPKLSRDDARRAWAVLCQVVEQFPFETPEDRAVWVAAVLNQFARPAIDGPVPGIAVRGNRAGCGKGLLINCVGWIGYGRSVPTSNYPADAA